MAKVVFENIYKRYGDNEVVKDLNLTVLDQEFLVLVGPSGCGKSTALRMIAGLETVSSGKLYIGERDVTRVAAKNRDVAMVFQSYALYPHMKVFDNMAFTLKLAKVPKAEIEERVKRTAEMLGITDLLYRTPRQMSGGQRQRVALGRAIVRNPAVFLMDEPLSNLDAKLRVHMRMELGKLHQALKVTTFYVTHDQVEAMTMGDRIAVINYGVLQQVAPPMELYSDPANTFVATFIGSPALNMFEGELTGDQEPRFKAQGLEVPVPQRLEHAVKKQGARQVTLGIRPEHISLLSGGSDSPGSFVAKVEVVEPMGNEIVCYLSLGDRNLVARLPANSEVSVGANERFGIDDDHLHLFDTEATLAIR